MRYLIISSLLLLRTSLLFSQTLSDYYNNVYKAEDFIMQGKYDSSSFHYKQAFKTKFWFAKDIYNHLVVCIKTSQTKIVNQSITKLIGLGATINSLETNPVIKSYLNNCSVNQIEDFRKIKPTYNVKYRLLLKQLEDADQKIRQDLEAYTTKRNDTRQVDQENVKQVLNLIDKYGFPSESKVGIDKKSLEIPHLSILMIHQIANEFQVYNFTNIITTAFNKGQLQNKLANLWSSYQNSQLLNFAIVRYGLIKIVDTTKPARLNNVILVDTTNWFQLELQKDEIKKVNFNRSRFLLEPYNKFVLKEVFAKDNDEFIIGEGMNVLTIRISDEQEFRKLKEKHK